MRRFFLLQPRFPATLPPGATRFSPTVMTQGWLVVVQVSRPRTRVAGGQVNKRVVLKKNSRSRALRKQTSRKRKNVKEGQKNTRPTKVSGVQNDKRKQQAVQISRQ